MTDRRSGPPLFDLMRERGQDPNAPKPSPAPSPNPAAAPSHGHKPMTPAAGTDSGPNVSTQQTAWDSSGGVSRAERSAAAMLDSEVQDDSGIRIAAPMFYTLIAVAMVLIVAAWTVGYQRGQIAGKAEIEPFVRDQPVVRQPATQDPVEIIQGTTGQSTPQSTTGEPITTTPPPASIPKHDSGVMSPSGFLTSDPRESGLNYLVLATLSTEQAADAISYLYSQGVTVIGVPALDSGSSRANNPSRYTLYSLGVAIPSNQWSAMSVERSQHQALIASLGSRWQRERRGGSDFSQTNWEKYE